MTTEQQENGSSTPQGPEETSTFNIGLSVKSLPKPKLPTFSNPLGDSFPLYTRPVQRQRWGDHQVHPVVNWGDLFFDLFYVGAAYNLSYIIVTDLSSEGLLYFLGVFFPVMQLWLDKTFYDSRFFFGDDLFHRMFEIGNLCALATAIVHIRPVDILSRPSESVDMFGLCLGLLLGTCFTIFRFVEVLICVKGGPEAKAHAKRDIISKILPFSLYMAATIVAGIEYYSGDSYTDEDGYNETKAEDDDHRMLAESSSSEPSGDTTNIPIALIFAGSLCWIGFYAVMVVYWGGKNHKLVTVPTNISFVIHRYGEWTMLMLGESILSLLIVDVVNVSAEYYLTFYAGILSVVLLQYMYFRSQPHHPDEHAMRRSKEQGILFMIFMSIYSAGLVLVGTAYKMLVNEHVFANDNDRRMLVYALHRLLAGGDDSGLSTEDRQQRVANYFCESMALVWFCSDLLLVVHKGLKDNLGRCRCKETHQTKILGVLLLLARGGLIAFIATLPMYVTDPTQLSLIGLAGIVAQLVLRFIGSLVFPDDRVHAKVDTQGLEVPQEEAEDVEERKWPNVTHAVAEPAETEEK